MISDSIKLEAAMRRAARLLPLRMALKETGSDDTTAPRMYKKFQRYYVLELVVFVVAKL